MNKNYNYGYNSLKIMKIIVTTLIIAVLLMTYLETKTKEQELKNKQMLEMADKMQQELLLKEAKKMNEEMGDNNKEIFNPEENPEHQQEQEQYPQPPEQEIEQQAPQPPIEPTGDLRTDASNKAAQGDFLGALNDYAELYRQTNFREDLMNVGEMSLIINQKQPLKDLLEQHLRAHPEDSRELEKYSSFVNEQY